MYLVKNNNSKNFNEWAFEFNGKANLMWQLRIISDEHLRRACFDLISNVWCSNRFVKLLKRITIALLQIEQTPV